jgi:hypothetical protein
MKPESAPETVEWLRTISTLVSIALGVIALWKAVSTGKAAAAAKVAAADASARAEEALAAAKRASEALAGLHQAERERREYEDAQREAPGILREWIARAILDGRVVFAKIPGVISSYPFVHERIANLAELHAARLAADHSRVDAASPNPRIGEPFEMRVANPERA